MTLSLDRSSPKGTKTQRKADRPTRAGWISETTKQLQLDRTKLLASNSAMTKDKVAMRKMSATINNAVRADWRAWLDGILTQLDKADEAGDYKSVQYLLGLLGRKKKKGANRQPTVDMSGNRMTSAVEEAAAWRGFLELLFASDELYPWGSLDSIYYSTYGDSMCGADGTGLRPIV